MLRTLLFIVAVGSVAACSRADDTHEPPPSAKPVNVEPAPSSDAEIAGFLHEANKGEVAAGKLAAERTTSAAVRVFAGQMVRDHEETGAKAKDVFATAGITPASSAVARAVQKDGDTLVARMQGLEGLAFDRAYVDGQVAAHEEVLRRVDHELIPGARDAGLKAFLTEIRPKLAAHLEHAKSVQQSLATSVP